jgi:hypothetical protein
LKTLGIFQWRKYLRKFQVLKIFRSCKKNERIISFLFHHFILIHFAFLSLIFNPFCNLKFQTFIHHENVHPLWNYHP